jgi:hypothetical protein
MAGGVPSAEKAATDQWVVHVAETQQCGEFARIKYCAAIGARNCHELPRKKPRPRGWGALGGEVGACALWGRAGRTIKVFSASNNLYFGKEGLPYRWSFFLTCSTAQHGTTKRWTTMTVDRPVEQPVSCVPCDPSGDPPWNAWCRTIAHSEDTVLQCHSRRLYFPWSAEL